MFIDSSNIESVFRALDLQISLRGGSPISLVVCGGTALAALGFLSRTTKDTDVLGEIKATPEGLRVVELGAFPDWLVRAADVVKRDFGLPDNWLNLGPASQVKLGFPEGFVRRLQERVYGDCLILFFIGRLDQIHFKLYAAADRDDYHTQDLMSLGPTSEEMELAARWALTQDVSEPFRVLLKDFLERIGFGSVAERI